MSNRVLIAFHWDQPTDIHFQIVQRLAKVYDELIFVVFHDEITIGRQLEYLHEKLSSWCIKPFYLLPIPSPQQLSPSDLLRWRIICPSFCKIYSDHSTTFANVKSLLKVPVEVISIDQANPIPFPSPRLRTRGLFITRAQPFHLGHAAIIKKMSQEVDEVIVLVAMAHLSHQPDHVASAGERLEMILPFLHQEIPSRFHLVALPYQPFTLENILALDYLLPPFQYVYTHNPSVAILAKSAGYGVRTNRISCNVSGSRIRECIVHGLPYAEMVPPSVYDYLIKSNIPSRLKQLAQMETR